MNGAAATSERLIVVCLPSGAQVPDDIASRTDVELMEFAPTGLSDNDLGRVHVFVPPYDLQAEVAASLPKMDALSVVQTLTSGIDWLGACIPSNAVVCNAARALSDAVAEWIVAAILLDAKRFPEFLRQQAECQWTPRRVRELAGETVMILGWGSIGRAVERRLAAFDMNFIRVTRAARDGSLTLECARERLPEVDILLVLLPLTDQTRGAINAELLGRLRAGALVVNAARGAIIDAAALTSELRQNRLRAVIDVTDPEPLPSADPLWSSCNAVITPHIAAETSGCERRAYDFAWAQLRRYLSGEELQSAVISRDS